MVSVYILYSKTANSFYIGQSQNIPYRIDQHNNHVFKGSFTAIADDWVLYLAIECAHKQQALAIERHIKRMKSKIYLENLVKYPDIVGKLLMRYQ